MEGLRDPRGMFGGGRWKDECGAQETCKVTDEDLVPSSKQEEQKMEGGL